MQEWWESLTRAAQFFYGMAAFFSVFFIWQLIAAFCGLAGDDVDVDGSADIGDTDGDFGDVGDAHGDAMEAVVAFKVLSFRSLVTFFTLFSWGSALYLSQGSSLTSAMGIAAIWGLVGMFAIALIFYGMGRLTETGTKDVHSCKGQIATVYLNIPADGFGEIKTEVSGTITHVKARSTDGSTIPAGQQVRVAKIVNQTLVEVEQLNNKGA